jgi:hypothetical protein
VVEFIFLYGFGDFSFRCPVYEIGVEVIELITSSHRQLLEFILCGYQAIRVVINDFQMLKDLI